MVDMGGAIPLETFRQQSLEEAEKAREVFESFMREHNIPHSSSTTASLSYGWLPDAAEGEDFVGNYGRAFDVIVLSRPNANTVSMHTRAIESGLFESGRPILLSPPSPPSKSLST